MAGHKPSIDAAVDAIASAYHILGAEAAPAVGITYDGTAYQLPMGFNQAASKMKPLLDAARDSGFGKGMGKGSTTEQDPSIRVAKELSADQFSVFGVDLDAILQQVHQALVPEAASVRAELYKLNIMTKGGFFKPHKDTPRGGPTCFGSLVVCLPVPFKGGALKLKHGGEGPAYLDLAERLFRECPWWDRERGPQWVPKDATVNWVAFFGDVEHEVEEVRDGMRLTLTYTLHREEAAQGSSSSTAAGASNLLLGRAGRLHDVLAAALADPAFMKEGGTLGYGCRHLYEESALSQAEAVLAAEGRAAYASKLALKNEDAVVAAVLAAAGLEVQVLRLLQGSDLDDDRVLRRMPTEEDKAEVIQMTWVEDEDDWAPGVTPEDVEKIARFTLEQVAGGKVEWLGGHDYATKLWAETYYTNTGWFGNEASQIDFYTGAALLVRVPKASARGALAAAAKQPLAAQQVGSTGSGPAAAAGAGAGAGSSKGPAAGAGSKRPAVDAEGSRPKRGRSAASSSPAPATAAVGPATLLFVQPSPGMQPSTAQPQTRKQAAAAAQQRTIYVEGPMGDRIVTLTIDPEVTLREIKSILRQHFGPISGKIMGALWVLDTQRGEWREAKNKDLVHGAWLKVNYVASNLGYWCTGRGGRLEYRRGPQPAVKAAKKAAAKKAAKAAAKKAAAKEAATKAAATKAAATKKAVTQKAVTKKAATKKAATKKAATKKAVTKKAATK